MAPEAAPVAPAVKVVPETPQALPAPDIVGKVTSGFNDAGGPTISMLRGNLFSPNSLLLTVAVGGLLIAAVGAIFLRGKRPVAQATPISTVAVKDTATTIAPKQSPPQAFLVDLQGATAHSRYLLGDRPTIVGRTGGDDPDHMDYLVIDQETLGRRHAVIKLRDEAFWVIDQGNPHGTHVNNTQITGEYRLRSGDRIKFDTTEFEFLFGPRETPIPRLTEPAEILVSAVEKTPEVAAEVAPAPVPAYTLEAGDAAGTKLREAAYPARAELYLAIDAEAGLVASSENLLGNLEADLDAFFTEGGVEILPFSELLADAEEDYALDDEIDEMDLLDEGPAGDGDLSGLLDNLALEAEDDLHLLDLTRISDHVGDGGAGVGHLTLSAGDVDEVMDPDDADIRLEASLEGLSDFAGLKALETALSPIETEDLLLAGALGKTNTGKIQS